MSPFDMAVRVKEDFSSPQVETADKLSTLATSPTRLVRSRRRRYLSLHPSYFTSASADVELADPLSYDRMIRQHQSAAEREVEGKSRGWAKTLETSLIRGEAKLEAARQSSGTAHDLSTDSSQPNGAAASTTDWSIAAVAPGQQNSGEDSPTQSEAARVLGQEQWYDLVARRFIDGKDENFDYSTIDDDDELDVDEGVTGSYVERKKQEDWFNDEIEDDAVVQGQELTGQTGVQDF